MPQRMLDTQSSSTSNFLPAISIDLGASYMHGCETASQPVFDLAVEHRVRAAIVAGGKQFEDTETAFWFRSDKGDRVESFEIARMHTLWYKIDTYMGKLVSKLTEKQLAKADVESLYRVALKSILRRFYSEEYGDGKLSDLQNSILRKLIRRTYGYVSNLKETGLEQMRPAPGERVSNVDIDSKFGSRAHVEQEAKRIEDLIEKSRTPEVNICKKEGEMADRLLVDTHKWLVELLSDGIPILYRRQVSSIKVFENESNDDNDKGESKDFHNVLVGCKDGTEYSCRAVICTVPLPVLKNISIHPPFSKRRCESLQKVATGAHNKIILRFDPSKMFWPSSVPQFNCDDQRFQFLNLHAYGKLGMLMAHIFPPYAFSYGDTKNDNEVVMEVLKVLARIFKTSEDHAHSALLDYRVTRWHSDPHSQGSYSYLKPGGRYADLREISKPHPPRSKLIYFAGEAMALVGFQCVHGAYITGREAAESVHKQVRG
mmetsp:Transcript_423/g.1032  ORF Transcript_423/g.1032 Transcript_423/m.1032 type:complete len:486 (+) Transcript_423:55-1512(+)